MVRIYSLKVSLEAGRALEYTSTPVWRTIEIKGSQTLHGLHRAILKAFDRFEDHLYSFYLSKNWRDLSHEYVSPYFFEEDDYLSPEPIPNDAKLAKLDSLDLSPGRKFDYVFDYGDYWRHEIQVVSIRDEPAPPRYPRVVERQGESPDQYPEPEDDEWEEPDLENGERGRIIPLFRDEE